MSDSSHASEKQNKISLQVITTSGNYPAGDALESFNTHEKLSTVLKKAAKELKLQGTDAWVAKDGERVLTPSQSIGENGLTTGVKIYWAPVEPGGGACTRS